jgi:hypothetical protein
MNYEVNDFREPEKPKLGTWPFWQVPEVFILSYLIRLAIFIVVIPYLFGVMLTPIGLLLNFLLIDYFIYRGIKTVYGLE